MNKNYDTTLKKNGFFSKFKLELKLFKKNGQLTLIALPAIIAILVFNYLPLYGLILPFKRYYPAQGIIGSPWVGLKNFEFLFKTGDIWNALGNTIFYNLIFIFIGTAVSVLIALMLYEFKNRFVKTYQTALLIPYFMSWVVVAYVFNTLLDMEHGLFNQILALFGKDAVNWYNEAKQWPAILSLAGIWKNAGYNAVVYFAALMGLDSEYFEAARIDGASKFRQMWSISIPLIRSVITIMIILNIGKIFYGDFGLFYNVTMNSPLLYSTTDIIDTYVYRTLTSIGDIGMASTPGFAQSVCGFVLVLLTNWIVKKKDPESALF